MISGNDLAGERPLFSALLTPHRSLSAKGFVILMVAIGAISFAAGLAFLLMGAWPVFGFFGLDVALIWWAFRINYRHALAYEEVQITVTQLRIRKVSHRGVEKNWVFNPLWVRLEREAHDEFGVTRLYLVNQGRELTIASCLGPDEKADFAAALAAALAQARRGPDINPVEFAP